MILSVWAWGQQTHQQTCRQEQQPQANGHAAAAHAPLLGPEEPRCHKHATQQNRWDHHQTTGNGIAHVAPAGWGCAKILRS